MWKITVCVRFPHRAFLPGGLWKTARGKIPDWRKANQMCIRDRADPAPKALAGRPELVKQIRDVMEPIARMDGDSLPV